MSSAGDPGTALYRRREALAVGAGAYAGLALGLTACGGGDSNPRSVTLGAWPDPTGSLDALVKRFNRTNREGIKVKLRKLPADVEQYTDQLRTQFQAGSELIDVFTGSSLYLAQFASSGWLADLSDRFTTTDQHLSSMLRANEFKGTIYGVPWFTDASVLYYRRDLLERAGSDEPPATWDELRDVAKAAVSKTGTKYGFVFQGANYEGGVVNAREHIWTAGGDVTDPKHPTTVTVGEKAAILGLTEQRKHVSSGVAPASVRTFKEDESGGAFLAGDAVFLRNWSHIYALLSNKDESKVKPEQVGVASLPTARKGLKTASSGGGWSFHLSATSKKHDSAWKFIEYMSSPEAQSLRARKGGYLPTLTKLYDDRKLHKGFPILGLVQDVVDKSRIATVSPYYSDMADAMGEKFFANLGGDLSPSETATSLEDELETIIKRGESAG